MVIEVNDLSSGARAEREMEADTGKSRMLKAAFRAPISLVYLLWLTIQYSFRWMLHYYARVWGLLAYPFTLMFIRRTKYFDPRMTLINERRDALMNATKTSFSWWLFYALGKDAA